MDCQMAARRRAAGMELPMMSRNTCSKAHWIWRKQAEGWRGAGAGGAGAAGRHGAADDVAEHLLEGALDLAEAGEGVAGIVTGGQAHGVDVEEAAPVG